MIFSQSQFYDIVQYAESKNLDGKIFKHEISETFKKKNFWGKEVEAKVNEPYSIISIKNTDYYFRVELSIFDYYREDRFKSNLQSYTLFGTIKAQNGEKYPNHHNIYFHVKYSPGAVHFHTTHKRIGLQNHFSWTTIYEFAKLWVNNLVDEIHAIESLSKINLIPDFFSKHRIYNENPYSGTQSEMIKGKIKLLKSRINEEIPMNQEQSNVINDKLDELIRKVDKINKFDFRTLFFGIMTNIASSVI